MKVWELSNSAPCKRVVVNEGNLSVLFACFFREDDGFAERSDDTFSAPSTEV